MLPHLVVLPRRHAIGLGAPRTEIQDRATYRALQLSNGYSMPKLYDQSYVRHCTEGAAPLCKCWGPKQGDRRLYGGKVVSEFAVSRA